MIKSGKYKKSLFIFNDNEEEHFTCKQGRGNAIIRPYNMYSGNKIYSAGISTGTRLNGGYTVSDEKTISSIDLCVREIKTLLMSGDYDEIYFSSDEDGFLGTSIFNVSMKIKTYITNEILKLEYLEY